MNRKSPWEEESRVKVLRLYRTAQHPNWKRKVNKGDLQSDWPRVVLLDLSAIQFREFKKDPKAFTIKHKIYPEQPIRWMSKKCATPPTGKGIPEATANSRWIVVLEHGIDSMASCAACPKTTTG